jgi:Predicted membrane-bound metal-dependent hydrolases
MDSVTHVVLGACIGEVCIGKKTGRRALFLGALAQSIPDIDFIASFWATPTRDLLAHRGFTHSILFIILTTPILAWLAHRWRQPHDVAFRTWIWFFALELFVHLALDTANAYGTGWLEPFSHDRFSYHTLFVADPLFTLFPMIAFIILLFFRRHRRREQWAVFAISWCAIYLVFGLLNKWVIERDVQQIAKEKGIEWRRHFTTPTPLNILLWYVVLEDDKGYHIGYRSVFDSQPTMDFEYFHRNDSLLMPIKDLDELKDLFRFSQGYYTVERTNDTLVFNDLRFGQMVGWYQPRAGFVFHYYLQRPYSNNMVVQRGRFANWNKAVLLSMWRRIKGN